MYSHPTRYPHYSTSQSKLAQALEVLSVSKLNLLTISNNRVGGPSTKCNLECGYELPYQQFQDVDQIQVFPKSSEFRTNATEQESWQVFTA